MILFIWSINITMQYMTIEENRLFLQDLGRYNKQSKLLVWSCSWTSCCVVNYIINSVGNFLIYFTILDLAKMSAILCMATVRLTKSTILWVLFMIFIVEAEGLNNMCNSSKCNWFFVSVYLWCTSICVCIYIYILLEK